MNSKDSDKFKKPSDNVTGALSDDELDISGGILYGGDEWEVGNRVAVGVSCACCGKAGVTGVISVVYRPKRDGVVRVSVTMDCCGGVGTFNLSDRQITRQ